MICSNGFTNTFIPDFEGTKRRVPIPSANLRLVQLKCQEVDDDLRWLISLISDSVMRLSEAVGLFKTDIHLQDDIPFINLVPHKWRPLKTGNSKRQTPCLEGRLLAITESLAAPSLNPHINQWSFLSFVVQSRKPTCF